MLLATCSEDGTIRLWGTSGNSGFTSENEDKANARLKPIERFFDMR